MVNTKWKVLNALRAQWLLTASILLLFNSACMSAYRKSVGADLTEEHSKIYLTDFNTAWQAVLDSLSSARLDVTNREGGLIQTRWTDNTAEKNFVDSFGGAASFLKAQYRFRVTVAKGFYNGQPSVKVVVAKEQMIQRDVLEGWRAVESDTVDEKTLIYRIGRLIHIRMMLAREEEERSKRALESVDF